MTTATNTRNSANNVELAKMICASAKTDLDIDEINHLVTNLIEIRDVKAAAASAKTKRIERMNAAKQNPQMADVIRNVNAQLERLGVGNIDEFAKKGDLKQLSDAMRASGMDEEQRFRLKANAAWLGLID